MLQEHLCYVTDRVRLEQFRAAIAAVLKPGDTAADLGCGSGILGLFCCRAGAARVFAIDSTAMIEVARETFERAGLTERAVFIRGHSHRVGLPESVDLVICDHIGYFGFDYGIIHTLQDARRRFLKPGGRLIPGGIQLRLLNARGHTNARGQVLQSSTGTQRQPPASIAVTVDVYIRPMVGQMR